MTGNSTTRFSLFTSIFCLGLALASSLLGNDLAYAQPKTNQEPPSARPGSQVAPVPASRNQVQAYEQQAGLSVCFLVKRNVEFKTALAANTTAVLLLLKQKHDNILSPSTTPFDPRKLTPLLSLSITLNAINFCPTVIPQNIKDEAQKASLKIKQSMQGKPTEKNAQ